MKAHDILSSMRGRLSERLARHSLRRCTVVGSAPRVSGSLWIHGEGTIHVGNRVFFDAMVAPIELYSWEGACIVIGDDSYIGGGTSIEATSSIALGARTRVGTFCKLMDNHFHPLVGDRNVRPVPQPVVIEDDVSLGARSIVLAGTLVARGTRAASGSVLRRSERSEPR